MKTVGRKYFGFYDDEAALVEQVWLKSRIVSHGKKLTYKAIADSMNRDGYKTQTGKPWYPIAIARILSRPVRPPKALIRPEKIKKTDLNSRDFITKSEIKLCRAAMRYNPDSERVIFEILLRAGLRASECCALTVGDLGVFGGRSQIDVRHGKGHKQRAVAIPPKLRWLLTDYITGTMKELEGAKSVVDILTLAKTPLFRNERGGQLNYSNLYDRIKKIGRRANVPTLHPHALRHTFAVHLLACRKDLELVRQQLGHANISTTQIYVKTLNESVLEQMKEFEESLES